MIVNFKNTRYKIYQVSDSLYKVEEITFKKFLFLYYKTKRFLVKPYKTKDGNWIPCEYVNSIEEAHDLIITVTKNYNYPKLIQTI